MYSAVDVLFTLIASIGRLDFRVPKKGTSCSFLGDSYAFGIAGTGGTTSSGPPVDPSFRLLSVGSLERADGCGGREDAADIRSELKLVFEEMEMPELYDFRFGSGVVRLDDGVTLFRGIIEGESATERRPNEGGSGKFTGGVCGSGGALGIIERRFILRASVGLIVRAPKPVACPGITESLFPDDGVVVPTRCSLRGDLEELID